VINIINQDCLKAFKETPDNSIHLIVTSPPYNVGINYGIDDSKKYEDYLDFMRQVIVECHRVLVAGGRLAINVPSCIRQHTKSRMAFLALDICLLMRKAGLIDGEWITWVKTTNGQPAAKCTAWGSYKSPSSPAIRDACEYIIVGAKEQWKREDRKGPNDMTKKEFITFTTNCWIFSPETNRQHPAPFPASLPYRLIKLYTWEGDNVLDPFAGSGTVGYVAKMLKRNATLFEISKEYCDMIKSRLSQEFLF